MKCIRKQFDYPALSDVEVKPSYWILIYREVETPVMNRVKYEVCHHIAIPMMEIK